MATTSGKEPPPRKRPRNYTTSETELLLELAEGKRRFSVVDSVLRFLQKRKRNVEITKDVNEVNNKMTVRLLIAIKS